MIRAADRFEPAGGGAMAVFPLAAFLLAGGLLAPAGPAGSQETMRLPAFGEVVDVRVINLEVVVTRRGERVGGLGARDFSLRVDGEQVEIAFFSEIASGRVVAAPERGAFPPLKAGAGVATSYLLFIDDDFTVPTSRNRVLEQLADQLGLLGDEDRVAVVAFDGRRLEQLSGWTRSLARLATVLEKARQRRTYGMLRRSELRRTIGGRFGPRPPAGSSFSGTGFLGLGRALAGSRDPAILHYSDGGPTAQVVRAASAALRAFASPPGRKVMLLLAGGWPVFTHWGDRDVFDRQDNERRILAPLVDTANRLGYTLYPVDVEGGTHGRAGSPAEQERERLFEDSLHYLAEETGGRAILAGAKLTAFSRVIEDTRSYYWLGFTPTWQGDGGEHRLEVDVGAGTGDAPVRVRGLKARTRRGFSDLSRRSEVSMWIESAHLFDTPLPDSIELTVEIGEPLPAGLGKILLPVSLSVPLDQATVRPRAPFEGQEPGAHGFVAGLELRVAATDTDGSSADLPVSMVEIGTDGPPRPGQIGVYETRLKLRRKPHRLLITLHDPLTGKVWARRVDFEP